MHTNSVLWGKTFVPTRTTDYWLIIKKVLNCTYFDKSSYILKQRELCRGTFEREINKHQCIYLLVYKICLCFSNPYCVPKTEGKLTFVCCIRFFICKLSLNGKWLAKSDVPDHIFCCSELLNNVLRFQVMLNTIVFYLTADFCGKMNHTLAE